MPNPQSAVCAALQLPADFSGRVLLSLMNGELQSDRSLRDDEHIASLQSFLELATMAGYQVIPPEQDGE